MAVLCEDVCCCCAHAGEREVALRVWGVVGASVLLDDEVTDLLHMSMFVMSCAESPLLYSTMVFTSATSIIPTSGNDLVVTIAQIPCDDCLSLLCV